MPDEERPVREADDRAFMRRALQLAARGWGRTAPNPMVGAVVVRDGTVVGEGWHAEFGGPHAEVIALRAAGDRARGATLYVTLEPCAHHGKTPPCADAVIAAGVARVVIACADPNPQATGGAARLRAAGVAVDVGECAGEARELDAAFFHAFESDRPWVILKLAVSLDGAIADHTRRTAWITGPEARAEVHRMRAGVDAVGVGIGTAIADDPALTVRDAPLPRVMPARVIFDSTARLPLDSQLVRTVGEAATIVVAREPHAGHAAALEKAGVRVLRAPDLAAGLRALRGEGIRSIMVEGGAALAGALIDGALADRLVIFRAPVILGAGALNAFAHVGGRTAGAAPRLRMVEERRLGADLMTSYAFGAEPCSQG